MNQRGRMQGTPLQVPIHITAGTYAAVGKQASRYGWTAEQWITRAVIAQLALVEAWRHPRDVVTWDDARAVEESERDGE